jgi:uncharacterized damage-inducible protein DinB
MTATPLEKLFEHNKWANEQILRLCSTLTDEQLDAQPVSVTKGTIRETLQHMVRSQAGYLSLLTLPVDQRRRSPAASLSELQESARESDEKLVMLAKSGFPTARLQTTDGFYVEPWVVVVQIINHATEHREQVKSMLTALGITPPDIDGWGYAEAAQAMVPVTQAG